jgi:hypothetical protein
MPEHTHFETLFFIFLTGIERIEIERMGLGSKLTTYVESAFKTVSTYVYSKLFSRYFFAQKKSTLVPPLP